MNIHEAVIPVGILIFFALGIFYKVRKYRKIKQRDNRNEAYCKDDIFIICQDAQDEATERYIPNWEVIVKKAKPLPLQYGQGIILLLIMAVGIFSLIPPRDCPSQKEQEGSKTATQGNVRSEQEEQKGKSEQKQEGFITSHRWTPVTVKDDPGGKLVYTSMLHSLNTISLDSPYSGEQKASIIAEKYPHGEKRIIISIQKGQLLCNHFNNYCLIRIKFDDRDIESCLVSPSADRSQTSFLVEDVNGFSEKLQKSKHLYIELPFYQQDNRTVEFMTEGFVFSSPP